MNKIIKFRFVKDCLLFGKKERFFVLLGVGTWFCICGLIATPIIITILIINQ